MRSFESIKFVQRYFSAECTQIGPNCHDPSVGWDLFYNVKGLLNSLHKSYVVEPFCSFLKWVQKNLPHVEWSKFWLCDVKKRPLRIPNVQRVHVIFTLILMAKPKNYQLGNSFVSHTKSNPVQISEYSKQICFTD